MTKPGYVEKISAAELSGLGKQIANGIRKILQRAPTIHNLGSYIVMDENRGAVETKRFTENVRGLFRAGQLTRRLPIDASAGILFAHFGGNESPYVSKSSVGRRLRGISEFLDSMAPSLPSI
jgi:hypothetical protein